MRLKPTKRVAIVGSLAVLVLGLWFWNRTVVVREDAGPDHFQLGRVHVGSTVEFSARFLVSSRQHPLDAMFERVLKGLPQSWSPALSRLHPKNFRRAQAAAELASLKPAIEGPAFVLIGKIAPEQRTNWFAGRPFVVVEMSIDTSRPGEYSGAVTVTLDRRRASLPVSVVVQEATGALPKLLIATTPYESYSTGQGSNFHTLTKMLSTLLLNADYRHRFPPSIERYQIILLADSTLVGLSAEEISRVRAFVERGGRLILACNAFMSGSVPQANQILKDLSPAKHPDRFISRTTAER